MKKPFEQITPNQAEQIANEILINFNFVNVMTMKESVGGRNLGMMKSVIENDIKLIRRLIADCIKWANDNPTKKRWAVATGGYEARIDRWRGPEPDCVIEVSFRPVYWEVNLSNLS